MAKSIIGRRVFYASSSICDNNSEMEHVASISKERQLRQTTTEYALSMFSEGLFIKYAAVSLFKTFNTSFSCLFIIKLIYLPKQFELQI